MKYPKFIVGDKTTRLIEKVPHIYYIEEKHWDCMEKESWQVAYSLNDKQIPSYIALWLANSLNTLIS